MPAPHISETTRGVFIISPTPFDESGTIDARSTDTLVDFYLEKGVTGITILGVLGEAPKLSGDERRISCSMCCAASTDGCRSSLGRATPARTIWCASARRRWMPAPPG